MHRGFLCITVHYIDSEWMLNKRIISFKTINTPHNGKNIANFIMDIMKKFQTKRENLKQYFANFEGKICLT